MESYLYYLENNIGILVKENITVKGFKNVTEYSLCAKKSVKTKKSL